MVTADIVYMAIPRFLGYATDAIRSYVDAEGYSPNVASEEAYDLPGEVVDSMISASDEVWVFGAESDRLPQENVVYDVGLTEYVNWVILRAFQNEVPVQIHEYDIDSDDIDICGRSEALSIPYGKKWSDHRIDPVGGKTVFGSRYRPDGDEDPYSEAEKLPPGIQDVGITRTGKPREEIAGKLVLHSHDRPCHHVDRLDNPKSLKIGDGIRAPESARFCQICHWGYAEEHLRQALIAASGEDE